MRRSAHRHHLTDAKPERDIGVLMRDRDSSRDEGAIEVGERNPVELDPPGAQRERAGEHLDQRRLPGSVRAEDRRQDTSSHVQVYAAEDVNGAVAGRRADRPEHGRLIQALFRISSACASKAGMMQCNRRSAMETTTGNADKPRRVIKRYSNRKLYDTKDSRYVTLQQIGEMVRAGEEVQIIDNATKEDKTEVTLALIISEDLKSQPRSVPLGTLRALISKHGARFYRICSKSQPMQFMTAM